MKIDTVEGISKKDFLTNYFYKQKPVIIKGLLNGTPAHDHWNLEYIREKLGKTEVDVYDNSLKKTSAYTHGDLKMPFSDFIDVIATNKPSSYRLFLFDGFKYCPDLRKDFPCPSLFHGMLGKIGFMFFGGTDTKVRMHFDIDMSNVLHTQFVGRKRIILFAPEYNDLLYKTPLNTYSIADMDNPDYEKFPGLRYVKGYDVMLEHGDSLFMPSGYWHYIIYQEGGFGVAYRKLAHSFAHKMAGVGNLTYRLWIDKLMNAVMGKTWVDYKTRMAFKRANKALHKAEAKEMYQNLRKRHQERNHGGVASAA